MLSRKQKYSIRTNFRFHTAEIRKKIKSTLFRGQIFLLLASMYSTLGPFSPLLVFQLFTLLIFSLRMLYGDERAIQEDAAHRGGSEESRPLTFICPCASKSVCALRRDLRQQ